MTYSSVTDGTVSDVAQGIHFVRRKLPDETCQKCVVLVPEIYDGVLRHLLVIMDVDPGILGVAGTVKPGFCSGPHEPDMVVGGGIDQVARIPRRRASLLMGRQ